MTAGLDDEQNWMERVQALGVKKSYTTGDPIVFQGEKAKTIGIVLSGAAKATVYSEDGQETWIGRFSVGDFLGHTALLTDSVIDFEFVAETDAHIVQIPVQKFSDHLDADNQLAGVVARDLAMRLNVMTNRLVEAITLSAPGRVCAELVRMSQPVGLDPDKMIIRPNPVFIDIALRVSSTRETVSRTVNGLLKDGVVSREAGAILVHQPQTLKSKIK